MPGGRVTRGGLPPDGSLAAPQVAVAPLLMVLQCALLLVAATTIAAFESFPHGLRWDFRSEGKKRYIKSQMDSFLKPRSDPMRNVQPNGNCRTTVGDWQVFAEGDFFFTRNLAIY